MDREINNISISLRNIRYYYENIANYYFRYYTSLFILLCKLDTIYRCIVYNGKTLLWRFTYIAISKMVNQIILLHLS